MKNIEAIQLFVRRACVQRPNFSLNKENWPIVVDIVQKLDRLPLAIELAAARISTLNLREIVSKLSNRFTLLRSKLRSKEQKTLLAAVEWSWDLLSGLEQSALVQCSSFQGGFTLSAAEEVVQINTQNNISLVLESLFKNSLLRKEEQSDGSIRYLMLAFIQEFSAQKCNELQLSQIYERHAEYFANIIHSLREKNNATLIHKELLQDLNNLLSASRRGSATPAHLCCLGALDILRMRGPTSLAIELTENFLNRENLSIQIKIAVLLERIAFLRINGKISQAKNENRALLKMVTELHSSSK